MHKTHHDPELSIREGYEVSDINIKIVLISGIVLSALALSSFIIIVLVVKAFERRTPMNSQERSPFAEGMAQAPAGALLQQDPVGDKEAILKEAQSRLHSYGLVNEDPQMTRAFVPVERAMELVAAKQVPYRQQAQVALDSSQGEMPSSEPRPESGAPSTIPMDRTPGPSDARGLPESTIAPAPPVDGQAPQASTPAQPEAAAQDTPQQVVEPGLNDINQTQTQDAEHQPQ